MTGTPPSALQSELDRQLISQSSAQVSVTPISLTPVPPSLPPKPPPVENVLPPLSDGRRSSSSSLASALFSRLKPRGSKAASPPTSLPATNAADDHVSSGTADDSNSGNGKITPTTAAEPQPIPTARGSIGSEIPSEREAPANSVANGPPAQTQLPPSEKLAFQPNMSITKPPTHSVKDPAKPDTAATPGDAMKIASIVGPAAGRSYTTKTTAPTNPAASPTLPVSTSSIPTLPPRPASTQPAAGQTPTTAGPAAPQTAPAKPMSPHTMPIPAATENRAPKYKMKRTGRPGLPAGMPLNVLPSCSPSNSPSMTPPPQHSLHSANRVQQRTSMAPPSQNGNPKPSVNPGGLLSKPTTPSQPAHAPITTAKTDPSIPARASGPTQATTPIVRLLSTNANDTQTTAPNTTPAVKSVVKPFRTTIRTLSVGPAAKTAVNGNSGSASNGTPAKTGEKRNREPESGSLNYGAKRAKHDYDAAGLKSVASGLDAMNSAAIGAYESLTETSKDSDSDSDDASSSDDAEGADEDADDSDVSNASDNIDDSDSSDSDDGSLDSDEPIQGSRAGNAGGATSGRVSLEFVNGRAVLTQAGEANQLAKVGRKSKGNLEDDLPALHFTPTGKPYNKWRDANGHLVPSSGAIIPDLYMPTNHPKLPWACPVRSCRMIFISLKSLGHHFARGHRLTYFNDNLDGTLTIVRKWESSESCGARVVSHTPLSTYDPLVAYKTPKPHIKIKTSAQPLEAQGQPSRAPELKEAVASSPILEPDVGSAYSDSDSPLTVSSPPSSVYLDSSPGPADATPREIFNSVSGRPYLRYYDGRLTYGVTIPDGYKTCSYPGYPWICPVRDCQRVLKALQNLGSHFIKQHHHVIFNDNCDGTLSKVGTHHSKRPIIVSQHRRSAAELEPLAKPYHAYYTPSHANSYTPSHANMPGKLSHKKKNPVTADSYDALATNNEKSLSSVEQRHPEQPQHSDLAVPIPANRVLLWEYIKPFLTRTDTKTMPDKGYAYLYLGMPRLRDIHWNDSYIRQYPFMDSQPRDLASLLVQVTGNYADEPCESCKQGKGPYEGCVIVNASASHSMNAAFDSCANCLYRNGHSNCSLKATFKPRFEKLFPNHDYATSRKLVRSGRFSPDPSRDTSLPTDASFAEKMEVDSSHVQHQTTSDNEPLSYGSAQRKGHERQLDRRYSDLQRRSERIAIKDVVAAEALTPDDLATGVTPKRNSAKETMTMTTTTTAVQTHKRGGRVAQESPLMFSGTADVGPAALEMEDWEVAPGRVQSDASENVAFSNAYLTSNQMVPIDHNMSYRVNVVRPGMSINFDADATATRICVLASGKLRVAVGNTPFVIGPNGMFKVKPGVAFSVENRVYIDSYLHISALHGQP